MLRILIFSISLLASLFSAAPCSWAQSQPAPPDTSRRYVETMPVFPGGSMALLNFLSDSIRYPALALRDQIQGKVYISFVVSSEGRTTNIQVKQGLRADIDAEALRSALRLARVRWQPGMQNYKPVNVSYTVPLTFKINNGTNSLAADSLDALPMPLFLLPSSTWTASRGPLPPDRGLVYGSCVQRLGFSSGGLAQDVRLINLDTRKVVRVVVKPTMSSRKQNDFCVALPPGRYALHQYYYTYGMASVRKANLGAITETRYVFVVQAGQLNYVGTWNFSEPLRPNFSLDKSVLDERINPIYTKLGFAEAVLALPK